MEERTQERAKCYHLLQEKVGRPTGWLYYMERGLVEMQKLLRVDRLKRNGMERLYCGSQWFSITGALAKYVLSKEDWIKSAFSYGCCVDECFLQTLVMQSAFAGNLSMPPEIYRCRRKLTITTQTCGGLTGSAEIRIRLRTGTMRN